MRSKIRFLYSELQINDKIFKQNASMDELIKVRECLGFKIEWLVQSLMLVISYRVCPSNHGL